MCQQWFLLIIAIPLSFLGIIQDLGSSHFIGKSMDAMKNGEWDDFDEYMYQWIYVIAIGSIFSGLRDYLYGLSSEKIGMDIRARFYEAIIRKDTGFFDERKVGDIRKLHQQAAPHFIFISNRAALSNLF